MIAGPVTLCARGQFHSLRGANQLATTHSCATIGGHSDEIYIVLLQLLLLASIR